MPDDAFVSAGWAAGPGVPNNGKVQDRIDAYEGLYGNRTIRIWGDEPFVSASLALSHVPQADLSDTGDSDITYVLTWQSYSDQVVIEYAGHLAVGVDGTGVGWGPSWGSGVIPGGPYHQYLGNLDDDSVGNQDNQIKADDIIAPGFKSGMKFLDLNANGVKDQNESGIAGWTINAYADDGDGILSSTEAQTVAETDTTDANGSYSFLLDPGEYIVCEVQQPGYQQTYPKTDTVGKADCSADSNLGPRGLIVSLGEGEVDTGNDFGNASRATKEGFKFEDKDADGTFAAGRQDGGPNTTADNDVKLEGWTINAYIDDSPANGTLDAAEFNAGADLTAQTGANGSYTLEVQAGILTSCVRNRRPDGSSQHRAGPHSMASVTFRMWMTASDRTDT